MPPQKEITSAELLLLDKMRENLKNLQVDKKELESRNLVRFLRARNHNLENAENMFRKQNDWRENNNIATILEWSMPSEYSRTYWPWYVPGLDRLGNPVLVLQIGAWDTSKVGEVGYDIFIRFGQHSMELIWQFIQRLSIGKSMYKQFSIIFDMKYLSWRAITTLDAMQGVLEAVKTYESCFPETLHKAYIINAPSVFSISWKVIKPFISNDTHAKIQFLGGSDPTAWKQEICNVIDVDQLPELYGGNLPNTSQLHVESYLRDTSKEIKAVTQSETMMNLDNNSVSISVIV